MLDPRLNPQATANPPDRVVNFAVFGSAQIQDSHRLPGDVHGLEDCIQAILYIKVGFSLAAIAQDAQVVGVSQELFVKIEHVAMGIAFP